MASCVARVPLNPLQHTVALGGWRVVTILGGGEQAKGVLHSDPLHGGPHLILLQGGARTSGGRLLGSAGIATVHEKFNVLPSTCPVESLAQLLQGFGHPKVSRPQRTMDGPCSTRHLPFPVARRKSANLPLPRPCRVVDSCGVDERRAWQTTRFPPPAPRLPRQRWYRPGSRLKVCGVIITASTLSASSSAVQKVAGAAVMRRVLPSVAPLWAPG